MITPMLTLHEVSKKTGLSQNFIRLTKTKLGDILTPYIYRGDKNKLLFDESVILLFDRINTLKDEGLSLADIVHGFKHEFSAAMQSANKNKTKLNHTDTLTPRQVNLGKMQNQYSYYDKLLFLNACMYKSQSREVPKHVI